MGMDLEKQIMTVIMSIIEHNYIVYLRWGYIFLSVFWEGVSIVSGNR